jgi:predicted extracellular nuclease
MTKLLIAFCVCTGVAFSSCTSNSSETNEIKTAKTKEKKYPHQLLDTVKEAPFVFYNVENLFDTIDEPTKKDEEFLPESKKNWNSKRYLDKLEKLSTVITHPFDKNPIFIGLAEVENRFVVHDLLATGRLASSKYRVVHFESPDVRGIDVALAFDHKRFHMTHKEAIRVYFSDEPNFKTRDILYVKGVFYDSTEVHLFVNHWSSRRGGQEESEYKRLKAAQLLKSKVDSLRRTNEDVNVIIMGDFNDYPSDRSILEELDAGAIESNSTLVNLLLPYDQRGEGSHNYKGKWGALDQVIVSRSLIDGADLEIKKKEAHIIDSEQFLYTKKDGTKTPNRTYGGNSYFGGYSDHLAVYSILQLPVN